MVTRLVLIFLPILLAIALVAILPVVIRKIRARFTAGHKKDDKPV